MYTVNFVTLVMSLACFHPAILLQHTHFADIKNVENTLLNYKLNNF